MRTSLLILVLFCAGCGDETTTEKLSKNKNPFASNNEKIVIDGNAFEADGLMVELTDCSHEKLSDDDTAFRVDLKITNQKEHNKILYSSWSPGISDISKNLEFSSIEDEHGNYYMIVPSLTHVVKDLIPGKTFTDKLLFTELVPTAKKLKMTLIGNDLTDGKDLVFNLEMPDKPVQEPIDSAP